MKTTAMYYSAAGAQRVTVNRIDTETGLANITTRDGDTGTVEGALLADFRDEREED